MKKPPHDPKAITGQRLSALRVRLGKNQTEFWKPIGVTQSGGSRYESGRDIPTPTRIAIAHTYAAELSS